MIGSGHACRALALSIALALCTSMLPARADVAADKATAQALFDDGVKLMAEGKNADACPKLAESQRLDPSLGTLLRLATCYERVGKTASAWALYGEAAATAKSANQPAREKYANEHATALASKLSKLTIVVPPESDVPGLEVTRDGSQITRAQWGSAVPVDPGTITVAAKAPGKASWQTTVTIAGEGKGESVSVPKLTDEAGPSTVSSAAPVVAPSPAESETANDGSTQKTIGFVVVGAGVVGLAVGSIFGLKAISRKNDSSSHCRTDTLCDSDGLALRDDAHRYAGISTAAFVVGGIATAAGVVLVLTAKPSSEGEVKVGVGTVPSTSASGASAGMWLSGSF